MAGTVAVKALDRKRKRRVRIACGADEAALRAALESEAAGAWLELVLADGRRQRIARGADEAALRRLAAECGDGARIELVRDEPIAASPAQRTTDQHVR